MKLADPASAKVLAELLPDHTPDDRARIALDHQSKCLARAAEVTRALDAPSRPPQGTDLFLVCGDAISTPARVAVDADGAIEVCAYGPGDGTVLRASALLDERTPDSWTPRLVTPVDWAAVTFLFSDHLGMTRDPVFVDNVLYLLLEAPREGPAQ